MKIVLFILLIPFCSFGQTYVGENISHIATQNTDLRYNQDDYQQLGMINDSLSVVFYRSYPSDEVNFGTFVFYNSDGIVMCQELVYKTADTKIVYEEYVYLTTLHFNVIFRFIDSKTCSLKVSR